MKVNNYVEKIDYINSVFNSRNVKTKDSDY